MKVQGSIAKPPKISAESMAVSAACGLEGLSEGLPLAPPEQFCSQVSVVIWGIWAARSSAPQAMTLLEQGWDQMIGDLDPDSDELPRLPLRLAASSAQLGTIIVVFVAATVLGLWVAQKHPVPGYLGTLFCAAAAVSLSLELMLGRNYLEITEEGFAVVRLFRSYGLSWGDVSHFKVVSFIASSSVAWDYSPKVPRRLADAWVNRLIIGADGTLINYALDYGLTPKGFARLLNRLRDRYA
jgi:hypothetical protein